MALIEMRITPNGIEEYNKVDAAIKRLQYAYEVSANIGLGDLYVAFSGGKDSVVLAELVKMSGVPYTLHYNITGIDPPELIYFMRENWNAINGKTGEPLKARRDGLIDLHWHMYEKSMWQLIIKKKMPPTRLMRYCCSELKERGGQGKVCATGVRWAESSKRKKVRNAFEIATAKASDKMLFNDNDEARRDWENCTLKGKYICNPIIDWEDVDVWEFIRQRKLKYCKLYDEGFKRLGCIGCPLAGTNGMLFEFEKYPKFKNLYIWAFGKMIEGHKEELPTWKTGEDVFNWWVYGGGSQAEGQQDFFDLID